MIYAYFVSYCGEGGVTGMIEITRPKEVEDYDDVLSLAESIEKHNNYSKVIIVNYILLKKPSQNILEKIRIANEKK